MKVKLSVFERIVLGSLLPQEGNFITLKIIRKIQDDIGFTEEEHKLLQFKYPGEKYIDKNGQEKVVAPGTIHWDDTVGEKEFEFGEKAVDIIVDVLDKLDDQKKLRNIHYTLYEKFVLRSD